jgi:hypothetical protein
MSVLTAEEWDGKRLRVIPTAMPTEVYYEASYPLGALYFYGEPTATVQVELRTAQKLSQLAAVTDDCDMPDGYEEAITYNLALRIAPEFGASVSPDVAALAIESKARVLAANAPSPIAQCDPAVLNNGRRSYFNWLTGE